MQITETVHALKHPFFIPVNPELSLERFVYSFLLFGPKHVHLIDSGVAESENAIIEYIQENNRSVEDIKTLILTHSHPDHIGSAKSIKEQTGCDVFAHTAEQKWIEDVDTQFADRPVPGFQALVKNSVGIDRFLHDGDRIEIDKDLTLRVIHTPGHSAGSVALVLEQDNVLISADSILLPDSFPIYEDAVASLTSLQKLQALENLEWLLASWDEPRKGNKIAERMEQGMNYLKTIHGYIQEIDAPHNLSPMDLCNQLVRRMGLPPAAVNPLVARSFQSHINNLNHPIFQ